MISTFLSQVLASEPITVDGDGEQTRDFVHVSDVVRANLLAATADDVGEAYNVGSGTRTSIRALAETVREVTGADVPIGHGDARPGDVRHSVADLSRSRRRLGFEPSVDLEEGLRALVERRSEVATTDRTARVLTADHDSYRRGDPFDPVTSVFPGGNRHVLARVGQRAHSPKTTDPCT